MNKTLLETLQKRYTTKHYDETKKISKDNWHLIEEAVRLAPTSVNGQPCQFFVAHTQEAKEKLAPAILDFNIERSLKASHILVIAVYKEITEDYLQALLNKEFEDGRYGETMKPGLDNGRRHFVGLHQGSPEALYAWEAKQSYIALGFAMLVSAQLGIDSTALEGIDYDKMDEILGFEEKGLRTTVAIAFGYRDEADANASRAKSRWDRESVIHDI